MPLTPEEGRRLHVLSLLERGQLTTAQAAEALRLTSRQVRRLRRALQRAGPDGARPWESRGPVVPAAPGHAPRADRRPRPGAVRGAQ